MLFKISSFIAIKCSCGGSFLARLSRGSKSTYPKKNTFLIGSSRNLCCKTVDDNGPALPMTPALRALPAIVIDFPKWALSVLVYKSLASEV